MSSFVSPAKYFRLGRFRHMENMRMKSYEIYLYRADFCIIQIQIHIHIILLVCGPSGRLLALHPEIQKIHKEIKTNSSENSKFHREIQNNHFELNKFCSKLKH